MTKVFLERDGNRYTVSAKGHAGSVETCASVSTLLYTLAGYLHNVPCVIEDERLDPGDARLCFHDGDARHLIAGETSAVETAFDMASVGFLQLEKSYPEAAQVFVQTIE